MTCDYNKSENDLTALLLFLKQYHELLGGFPGGASGKESACQCRRRDVGSNPGLGRPPEEGNGNPLQYPCLESSMDRGAQWAAVRGVSERQTRLSTYAHMHYMGEKARAM